MCGLLGVYSRSFAKQEFDYFERLLFISVFRGQDSTGVIRLNPNATYKSRKSILASPEFLSDPSSDIVRDVKELPRPISLLGHTRAATKGAVSLKNAHPFTFENVIGMHNGTIHTQFKGRKDFETDSEALYKLINDDGLESALNEIQAWDTAYALQFIDKKNKTLNFVRNSKRPLWFTYMYAGTTLIWASEKEYLKFVLSLSKDTTNSGWKGNKEEPYFTLAPYDLLSFKIDEAPNSATVTKLEVKESSSRPFTGTGVWTSGTTYTGGRWVKTNTGRVWIKDSPTESSIKQSQKKYVGYSEGGTEDLKRLSWLQPQKKKDVIEEDKKAPILLDEPPFDVEETETKYIEGFEGQKLSEKEFQHRLQRGCFCCSKKFSLDDPHDFQDINAIRWWSREEFACNDCYENSEGDWVRHSIDDTWDQVVAPIPVDNKVKKGK